MTTIKVVETATPQDRKVYADVNAKRKVWVPVKPEKAEKPIEGSEDVLSRMLALRCLEIPVKNFILEGLSREDSKVIGKEGIETLLRNTEDEERHDKALNNCVAAFDGYNSKYEKTADSIADAWIKDSNHPILKTAYLETSVFFVMLPFIRKWGFSPLRVTSIDISADEVGHVRSHRQAARRIGHRPGPSLDKLRKATVAWMSQGLDFDGMTQDKLLSISQSLMTRGVSSELNFSRSYQQPAFFETSNDALPKYS